MQSCCKAMTQPLLTSSVIITCKRAEDHAGLHQGINPITGSVWQWDTPSPKRTHTEIVGYPREEPPITREVPIPDPDEEHDDGDQ